MARADFPLCIYCDSDSLWTIRREGSQVVYNCGNCGNTIVVECKDD